MLAWLGFGRKSVEERLAEVLGDRELPSFPAVVLDALSALRDPDASLRAVGSRLCADPGISVQVLRLTNSAALGLRNPVSSVEQAACLIGRAQLESLLLGVGVSRLVAPAASRSGLDAKGFWRAAARRASAARALAARLHPATKSECFTAALLSDLAVPLLADAKGEIYARMLREQREGGADLHALERGEFGWDHGTIGGALGAQWNLPELLSRSIHAHHEDADDLPPALHLASLLADEPQEEERFVEVAASRFGVPTDEAAATLEHAGVEAGSIAACFA